MKKLILYAFLVLLGSLHAKTIIVGRDYKTKTISAALQEAKNGDSILIHNGIYSEGNLIIDKSIALIGVNYPVLDGKNKVELITITSNNVLISGIKFINSGKSSLNDLAAVKLQKVNNVRVENNILENNYFGIYLAHASGCLIKKNKITGAGLTQQSSGNGIHLWKSDHINIIENESRGHRDGIYFEFVTYSQITKNISEKNLRYGLHFMFSDNDSYNNNIFRDNGAGVAVMYSKSVKMKNNHFELNWGSGAYGILLKDIRDSEIIKNTFKGNTTAIYAESASRIIIKNNSFIENGWALRITSSSDQINITQNNFIANTFDMATSTFNNITVNSYNGNYWDKYDGYDLDKNKEGDVPYYPVSLSAVLVEKIPTTAYFMHSFILNLINQSEKIMPNLIPEGIRDNTPSMKIISL